MKKRVGWLLVMVSLLVSVVASAGDRVFDNQIRAKEIWTSCHDNDEATMTYVDTDTGGLVKDKPKACKNVCAVFFNNHTDKGQRAEVKQVLEQEFPNADVTFFNDMNINSGYDNDVAIVSPSTQDDCDDIMDLFNKEEVPYTQSYVAVMKSALKLKSFDYYEAGCATRNKLPAALVLATCPSGHDAENSSCQAYYLFYHPQYPACDDVYSYFKQAGALKKIPKKFDDSKFELLD